MDQSKKVIDVINSFSPTLLAVICLALLLALVLAIILVLKM